MTRYPVETPHTYIGVNHIQAGFYAERGLIHVWATGAQLTPAQAQAWARELLATAEEVAS